MVYYAILAANLCVDLNIETNNKHIFKNILNKYIMKNFIKTTIVAAALALLSTGAFAANINSAQKDTVITGGEITAILSYDSNACEIAVDILNATQGNSSVTVYDAEGKVLLTDKFVINTYKVQKRYLMTDLAAGSYTIEVTSNNKTVKQGVVLSEDNDAQQYYSL